MKALRNFKTYFFRGMAALLPTILTIWIFVQCYFFVQDRVSIHINRGLVWSILQITDKYPKEFLHEFWVLGPGRITGFFIAVITVCVIGAMLASVVGRWFWSVFEKFFMNAPIIKKIYPHIKQVTDSVLVKKKLNFNSVVALQYPRKGVWSVGMVTGEGLKRITDSNEKKFLTVFVPSSPTPFTGYVIMTPKEETIELDMTIEEALRFTISGGVITPDKQVAIEQKPDENV